MSTLRVLRRLSLVPVALVATGCIASNVVAPEQRMVVDDLAVLAWQPAADFRLVGLYESIDVQGAAAQSLRRVWYLFEPDGTYTAAALTEADGRYAFQTLNGTWSNGPAGLVLDDAEPVQLEQAEDHLRISAPTGVLVLARRRGV